MHTPKKILIIYASAGLGHAKAAKAVEEACRRYLPEAQIKSIDSLKLSKNSYGHWYSGLYYWQIQNAPWLWAFFYYVTDWGFLYFLARPFRRLLNALTGKDLERILIEEAADVVITTHFMSEEVAAHLKSTGKIRSKLVVVVTDYLPHYVWTAHGVDAYCVAVEETKIGLVNRGVPADVIHVTGIPIEEKFLKTLERPRTHDFTVLVTSGGAGIGAAYEIVIGILGIRSGPALHVVCGKNEELQTKLKKLAVREPRLKVHGFVDNMHELMEDSDIMVGKGGGLTITESFSKGKPIIIFKPVPGQETRNVEITLKYHAGCSATSSKEVADHVRHIWMNKKYREDLEEGARRIARPEASKTIVELLSHA